MTNVKVGQVWADYDVRFRKSSPYLKRIVAIDGDYAVCKGAKRTTRILLKRFRPNSTGYILVSDVEAKP